MGLFSKKKDEAPKTAAPAPTPAPAASKAGARTKKILVSCGSGIVTSTIARHKIEEFLDNNGYKGKYEITQVPLASTPEKSRDYDFIVATSIAPTELHCPYVNGTPYLTGAGIDEANEQIRQLMES